MRKNELVIPNDVKSIIISLRSYLIGNSKGITRDEDITKQLINIIFIKLYDEIYTPQDDIVKFRIGVNESEKEVTQRIHDLFNLIKIKYNGIINDDKIKLDDYSLFYIVNKIQKYRFIDSNVDIISEIFETLIGHTLKVSQGQFFTPKNIVKLMVNILDPSINDIFIDPSCGSGSFIVEYFSYIQKKINQRSQDILLNKNIENLINGIDKDSFLVYITKLYLAILSDINNCNIFCEDSLENITDWNIQTKNKIKLNYFNCLLANPPFGKEIKIKGKEKLAQYKLAKKWKKEIDGYVETNEQNIELSPQILFIERCLDLLVDGGRMGLIIPETYFHSPRTQYVMEFMAKHNIFCLIDLPHNTFRPYNNAKCVAIFLEKNRKQQEKILMCVAEEMGHDHQGRNIFRWDYELSKSTNLLWDDIRIISDEINDLKQKNLSEKSWTSLLETKDFIGKKYIFLVNSESVKKTNIYVPRYYWQEKTRDLQVVANKSDISLISFQDLISANAIKYFDGHGSPESENKGKGEVPYIRVKDIVNWEVYKDTTSRIPYSTYQKFFTNKKALEECDILYVRRGSYRIGSVAMISPFDKEVLLTREILVLRVIPNNKYDITPYYLMYLLSHWIIQEQTKNKILIETTLPNIADRWKEILLPIHNNKDKILEISNKVKNAIDSKWYAVKQIQDIAKELGNLTI